MDNNIALSKWKSNDDPGRNDDDIPLGSLDRRLQFPDSFSSTRKKTSTASSASPITRSMQSTRSAALQIPLLYNNTDLQLAQHSRVTARLFSSNDPWQWDVQASTQQRGRTGHGTLTSNMSYRLWRHGGLVGGVVVNEPHVARVWIGGDCYYDYARRDRRYANEEQRRGGHIRVQIGILGQQEPRLSVQHNLGRGVHLSVSATPKSPVHMTLASYQTRHRWSVGFGWISRQPLVSLQVWVDRRWRLLASWKRGWTLQGTLVTKKNDSVVSSIGIQHQLTTGLVWIFTFQWSKDVTISVPIQLGASSSITKLWLRLGFVSLWTRVFHDVLDAYFFAENTNENDDNIATAALGKEREEAATQQRFMAKSKRIAQQREQQHGDLNIIKALYYCDGGDEWDVTIPLQFWVSETGRLQLPALTKRHMLGFYNVARSVSKTTIATTTNQTRTWWYSLLEGFWTWNEHAPVHKTACVKLKVRYAVGDALFEIVVDDEEEMVLPSDKAMRVE